MKNYDVTLEEHTFDGFLKIVSFLDSKGLLQPSPLVDGDLECNELFMEMFDEYWEAWNPLNHRE